MALYSNMQEATKYEVSVHQLGLPDGTAEKFYFEVKLSLADGGKIIEEHEGQGAW